LSTAFFVKISTIKMKKGFKIASEKVSSLYCEYLSLSGAKDLQASQCQKKLNLELAEISKNLQKKLFKACAESEYIAAVRKNPKSKITRNLSFAYFKNFCLDINSQICLIKAEMTNLFRNPDKFADHVLPYLLAHPKDEDHFIYAIFPAIYVYFSDRQINDAAISFITNLMGKEECPIGTIFKFSESFLNFCFSFHDVLWHDFKERLQREKEFDSNDMFDYFIESLTIAATTSKNVCVLFNSLISKELHSSFKFFIKFIKQSFRDNYLINNQMSGYESPLFNALDTLLNDDDESNNRMKLIYALSRPKYVDATPNLSTISASFQTTIITVSDILVFLTIIKNESIIKEIKKKVSSDAVCKVPISFDGNMYVPLPSIKGKEGYNEKWQKILHQSENEGNDPLSHLPLISGEGSTDTSLMDEEFTIFCLKSMIREVKEEMNLFEFAQKLGMIKKEMLRYEKLVDVALVGKAFTMILESPSIRSNAYSKPADTINDFPSQLISARRSTLNFPDLFYPLFIMKLNAGIKKLPPAIDELIDEFTKTRAEFAPDKEIAFLEEVISSLQMRIHTMKDAGLGDQFVILNEVGENIKKLQQLLDSANIEYSQPDLFKQVFTKEAQKYVIIAVTIFGLLEQQMAKNKNEKYLPYDKLMESMPIDNLINSTFATLKDFIIPNLLASYINEIDFLMLFQKTIAGIE
jgi:hypothetical protein